MAEFVNPYNFVRSQYDPKKTRQPLPHNRVHTEQYSGRLTCTLTTVSRVTTESLDWRKGSCIYGSSLKGVIRSMAEALGQCCFPLGGGKCQRTDKLCMCCRTFGWLDKGNVHLGRVHISDAKPQSPGWSEQSTEYIEWQALSAPKPRHHPFYDSGGRVYGRKFYYHHDPSKPQQKITKTKQHDGQDRLAIAKANQTFSFTVDFADLTGPELGLLLYALQLENDWFHKIGKAKPLGFGTVKITINTINLLPPNRYEDWDARPTPLESLPLSAVGMRQSLTSLAADADAETIWNGLNAEERRAKFTETRIEEFFQQQFGVSRQQADTLPHWCDLHHLLRRHDDYNIHYPSQSWFENHSSVELPTVEEVEGNPPGDRSKWLKE